MLSHQALCRCSRSRSGWKECTNAMLNKQKYFIDYLSETLFWNVESGLRRLRSSSAR